jgi:hypothetical protein
MSEYNHEEFMKFIQEDVEAAALQYMAYHQKLKMETVRVEFAGGGPKDGEAGNERRDVVVATDKVVAIEGKYGEVPFRHVYELTSKVNTNNYGWVYTFTYAGTFNS